MRALAGALALAGTTAAAQPPDLSGGGAWDAVEIAGFVLPVADVERMLAAGLMRYGAGRFAILPGTERALRAALPPLGLEDPRAVRDLYRAARVPLPNGAAHTLTIPSGYGPVRFANVPGRVSLGAAIGGVSRVPYVDDPDGGVALGFGFGNAFESVGVSLALSFNDLSEFPNEERISLGVEVSRYLWDGLSVAVGGENLLVQETDGQASYYLVASLAFDRERLGFDGVATLGIGTGRFAEKTERDTFEGKGSDATALFGGIAWEVSDSASLIAEWNGRNLALGGAFRLPGTPFSAKLGVRDLTDYTGDGPRLFGSLGVALARF